MTWKWLVYSKYKSQWQKTTLSSAFLLLLCTSHRWRHYIVCIHKVLTYFTAGRSRAWNGKSWKWTNETKEGHLQNVAVDWIFWSQTKEWRVSRDFLVLLFSLTWSKVNVWIDKRQVVVFFVAITLYDTREKFEEHERSIRFARARARKSSSRFFKSAFQTFQVTR